MNNFITLTKVFFLSGFNTNRKKKNQKSAFAMLGLTLALFAFTSSILSFLFFQQFKEAGMPIEYCLPVMIFAAIMLNLVLTMYQLQSIIFNAKDYEFLESLPVTKVCIVASKLTATYLINLAEDLALIVPAVIIFYVNGGTIVPGLIAIGSAVFASFLPILISAIIGSISALLSARSRHANFINIIISLLFFALFFGGYLYLTYGGAQKISEFITHVFFLNWIQLAIIGDYICFLYSVLFNLGAALIVIIMVALIYRPVNTWMNAGALHVDYDKVKKNIDTDLNLNRVLLKKEWLLIYRKPNYFINCILGELFFLIIGIAFILIPSFFVKQTGPGVEEEMPIIAQVFVFMVPTMGIMMNSIAGPSSTSLSMEGKYNIEMLRSYPINPKDIIRAKIRIALIMEATLNIFASTFIMIAMLIKGYNGIDMILAIYLYPQFAGAVLALAGILVGFRWPKLEFENETQVFKNSACANLPMLFVFLPSIILVGAHVALNVVGMEIPALKYVAVGSISLVYIIVIFILYRLVYKKGPKLFEKIMYK
ncbi:MAG: hypothetical protein IKP77_01435 [Acholeplasmatales bacterium]|nr:hypothetical protein [Acholeplasmatales bacterium]